MNWLLVHTNQGVHLGLKTVDFCYQFLQAGLILSHYYILRWSQVLILNLNMVQTIIFILAAAAIAPVISLPLPTNDEPVPGPNETVTQQWQHGVKRSRGDDRDLDNDQPQAGPKRARTSANSGNSAGSISGFVLTNEKVNIFRVTGHPSWEYVPYLSWIFMI